MSILPYGLSIFCEGIYNKSIFPKIFPLAIGHAVYVFIPLITIILDERLRIKYYKSNNKILTLSESFLVFGNNVNLKELKLNDN